MKQCPQCSTEYEDSMNFCANDGKSLVTKNTVRARLCPQCANSIPEDATNCSYCKGEIPLHSTPQWPKRGVSFLQPKPTPIRSKLISIAAMVGLALAGFFIGGYLQRQQ